MWLLLVWVALMNVGDSFFTLLHLQDGGIELNPVAEMLLQTGRTGFVALKSFLITVPLVVLCLHKNFSLARIGLWVGGGRVHGAARLPRVAALRPAEGARGPRRSRRWRAPRLPAHRMRIARVLTRLNLGGPARQALASDPLLAGRGHAVRLFAGTPEPGEGDLSFDAFARAASTSCACPGSARGSTVARDLRALAAPAPRARARSRPTSCTRTPRRPARSGGARRASARGGARAHVPRPRARGLLPRAGVARPDRRSSAAWRASTDRIVAVSHATADDLVRLGVVADERSSSSCRRASSSRRCSRSRSAPAAGDGALRRLLGAGADDFVVGVIGRLAEVKRPEWALEVFALLAPRYPRLHLVFVGDGDAARHARAARSARSPADERRRAHLVGARSTTCRAVLADLDARAPDLAQRKACRSR